MHPEKFLRIGPVIKKHVSLINRLGYSIVITFSGRFCFEAILAGAVLTGDGGGSCLYNVHVAT